MTHTIPGFHFRSTLSIFPSPVTLKLAGRRSCPQRWTPCAASPMRQCNREAAIALHVGAGRGRGEGGASVQELHTDWTTKFFRTDARKFPECPTSARRIAEDRCTVSSSVHPTIAVENTPAPTLRAAHCAHNQQGRFSAPLFSPCFDP